MSEALALVRAITDRSPRWWMQYIGGPDACVGCDASDAKGAEVHEDDCPVVALLALIDESSEVQACERCGDEASIVCTHCHDVFCPDCMRGFLCRYCEPDE